MTTDDAGSSSENIALSLLYNLQEEAQSVSLYYILIYSHLYNKRKKYVQACDNRERRDTGEKLGIGQGEVSSTALT